jgi:hypothetical protein
MYTLWNITKNIVTQDVKETFWGLELEEKTHYRLWGTTPKGAIINWERLPCGVETFSIVCDECKTHFQSDPKYLDNLTYFVCDDCEELIVQRETDPDHYCEEHNYYFGPDENGEPDELWCPECQAEDAYEDWMASTHGCYCLYSNA